jgi:hypothetical protein
MSLQIRPWNSNMSSYFPKEEIINKQERFDQSIESTQNCSWISILPKEEMKKLADQNKQKEVHGTEKEVQGLIQMLVALTLESIKKYKNSDYAQLDAHIGNNGCEVQAFNILTLAHSNELKTECEEMLNSCEKISKWIKNRQSSKPKERIAKFGSLDQVYETIQEMSKISPKMMYLIQSHLLTIIKEYEHDEDKFETREYEKINTTPGKLRKVYNDIGKGNVDNVLNTIISVAQSKLSLSSILFMRAELNKLPLASGEDALLIKKMLSDENLLEYTEKRHQVYTKKNKDKIYLPKTYSSNYYNAKALLLLLAELKSPLIIKKMTKDKDKPTQHFADFKPSGVFGQFEEMSPEEIEKFPAETPVIVCLAYLPDNMSKDEWLKKVASHGLGNMILANLSHGGQYIQQKPELAINDEEALQEIKQTKIKSKEMECIWAKASILDVDHFYCSNWGKRADHVGASNS